MKTQRKFTVVIERDEEGYYVATVPALRGCHTQGKTLDSLVKRVREAIELCLDVEDAAPPLAGRHSADLRMTRLPRITGRQLYARSGKLASRCSEFGAATHSSNIQMAGQPSCPSTPAKSSAPVCSEPFFARSRYPWTSWAIISSCRIHSAKYWWRPTLPRISNGRHSRDVTESSAPYCCCSRAAISMHFCWLS